MIDLVRTYVFHLIGPQLSAHLWQSTACIALAWLLTLTLRKNRAQVRYWIWFAASVKFLIPFSWLVALGANSGWSLAPKNTSLIYFFLEATALPPAASSIDLTVARHAGESMSLAAILPVVWLMGFAVVLVKWRWAWRKADAAVAASEAVTAGREWQALCRLKECASVTVPVVLARSRACLEPAVFGILKPVVLLPEAILHRLTSAQLDAILAHELAHIRRQDNLLAAVHMAVQALFWFHPLVWWLRVRLLNERERACDEAVLRTGSEPKVYAEGILQVCKFSLAAPQVCMSGITSAGLKERIERIMIEDVGRSLNRSRKIMLAAVALGAVLSPILVGLMCAPANGAQALAQPSALPSFAFATVKPSLPDTRLHIEFGPGGRLTVTHATLRFLMKIAYDVGDSQILGGPNWLESRRFDVEAKPEAPLGGDPKDMTQDQRRAMQEKVRLRLQRLLAERFQLKVRSESKEMPIFALVVGKNGPKMQPNTSAGSPKISSGHGELTAAKVSMDMLSHFLSEGQVGRPVVDRTDLKGNFDFKLQWSPDPGQTLGPLDQSNPPPASNVSGPSIFTALQQQIGLKLEARKSPADCVLIEQAELPVEN